MPLFQGQEGRNDAGGAQHEKENFVDTHLSDPQMKSREDYTFWNRKTL
jgi:hypothetical protein